MHEGGFYRRGGMACVSRAKEISPKMIKLGEGEQKPQLEAKETEDGRKKHTAIVTINASERMSDHSSSLLLLLGVLLLGVLSCF